MSESHDYKPGDVANGHVLGEDNQWHPLDGPDQAASPDRSVFQLSPDGLWFWNGRQWIATNGTAVTRRSIRRLLVKVLVVAVVVAGGFGIAYARGTSERDKGPHQGECAHKVSEEKVVEVDCESDRADFRVTSQHNGVSNGEEACKDDPESESYYTVTSSSRHVDVVSYVLCLAPLRQEDSWWYEEGGRAGEAYGENFPRAGQGDLQAFCGSLEAYMRQEGLNPTSEQVRAAVSGCEHGGR